MLIVDGEIEDEDLQAITGIAMTAGTDAAPATTGTGAVSATTGIGIASATTGTDSTSVRHMGAEILATAAHGRSRHAFLDTRQTPPT